MDRKIETSAQDNSLLHFVFVLSTLQATKQVPGITFDLNHPTLQRLNISKMYKLHETAVQDS